MLIPIEGSAESASLTPKTARNSLEVSAQAVEPGLARNSFQISNLVSWIQYYAIDIAGPSYQAAARNSLEIIYGDNFLIIADLIDSEIGAGTGFYQANEINAELLVNGNPVDITSFQYEEPAGKLGSTLNVVLAKKDPEQIPLGANITFRLSVRTASGTAYYNLMENGKLGGRDYSISYRAGTAGGPADEVTFGALDVIADRFGIAPRKPVILYDPTKVNPANLETSPRNSIIDFATGKPILPKLESQSGLTMRFALKRAYKTGLGFTDVVTNIPDYKISRADFSIESGWHSGTQPMIAMYGPIYFTIGTTLYIIDTEYPLPNGVTPRTVTLDDYKLLNQTVPYRPDANAVLLTYQFSASEDPEGIAQRTVVENLPAETSGSYGTPGYSETRTRVTSIEKFYPSEPNNVLSKLVTEVFTETRMDFGGGLFTVHRERETKRYQEDLQVSHDKRVDSLITTGPDRSLLLQEVLREKGEITWKDDPTNPGMKVQTRNYTKTDGMIYVSTEEYTRLNPNTGAEETVTRRYPALLAQKSGYMEDDGTLSFATIKVRNETLRHVNGNHYDCMVTEFDALNNTIQSSTTVPTTGSPLTDPYEVRSKTVLITDPVSEAAIGPRIPVSVNTGELPRKRAIELGQRVLQRLSDPLYDVSLSLPGVDFSIYKGTVLRGQLRDGYTPNNIVSGRGISGSNLGRNGHRISMSLKASELP